MSIWQTVPVHPRTIFDLLNSNFCNISKSHKDSLPDFRFAKTLLLGSDYSEESFNSPYVVYSFLLITLDSWSRWEPIRLQIREKYFTDSRRMSFKRLSNDQRKQALIPLLKAANSLDGLSFSVAIKKECCSLFAGHVPLDLKNPDFANYRKWKKNVFNKAFIIIHFLSFMLAGLAKPNQNVLWFTDEDSIAANDQRVCELTNLFGWIFSQYLTFDLGHCRCGTSRCDNGSKQIEDFLAIPDLIAGALAEQLVLKDSDLSDLSGVFFIHHGDFSGKTKEITWWFTDSTHSLKRLFAVIDPSDNRTGHKVSWFHFHNRT